MKDVSVRTIREKASACRRTLPPKNSNYAINALPSILVYVRRFAKRPIDAPEMI
jgi:hypothetical protein